MMSSSDVMLGQSVPPPSSRRREQVLLVDDEPQVLVALEDLLRDDFAVSATDEPERALKLVEQDSNIAVVISDQRMPRMSGDELLTRLRHCSPASRMLSTGYADLTSVVRAVNEGQIFAYVTKPWDRVDLLQKVQHAAGHFRLTQELQEERARLRASEERLRLAFAASGARLFDWDVSSGHVMLWNGSSTTEFGGEGHGSTFGREALRAFVHPEDLGKIEQAVDAHLARKVPFKAIEIRARSSEQSEYRWFEVNAQATWNDQGGPVRLVGSGVDVTTRREHSAQQARLDFLASYDDLTTLPNRTLLTARLERLSGTSGEDASTRAALVLLDVGRLRQVNETMGRRAGDALLRGFAARLGASLREGDMLARYEGGTFAILFGNVEDEAAVAQWLERVVRPALGEALAIEGSEFRLAAKSGIALFPNDGKTVDQLCANAEAALSAAKQGGQAYLFYTPNMNGRVAERLSLEVRLRRAVAQQEFLLYYQPKVHLGTGRVVGLEALIRWRDPSRGLVPPGEFIPLLEETGMILDVGTWVLREAALQHGEWTHMGLEPPPIAVNVSVRQLAQRNFVEVLDSVLSEGCAAGALDLEITESVLAEDLTGNIGKLRAAKDRGFRIAIDDFGTGYSSLGYLSRLPLDALKIDRSFVDTMAEDPQQMSIVTSIISLSHALGHKVIAEGVETSTQAQLLRLLRCDEIQGYLVSKPVQQSEVPDLLTRKFEISGRFADRG